MDEGMKLPERTGTRHMVVTGHPLATRATFEILEGGGNAIDAAACAGITLCVVASEHVNLGGIALILVYSGCERRVYSIAGVGHWPARMTPMESVYRAWDAAIAAGDISSLVNLYAPDAEIESPLIYEFTGSKTGVLRGREAFCAFYKQVARSQMNIIRPKHHDDYLARGRSILWEYPRATSSGERSEFVESWDFNERYEIQSQRVYWGWSRIAGLSQKGFGEQ